MREEQEEDRKVGVFSMRAGRPPSGSLQRASSRGRSDDPNVPPSLGFQSTGFQSTGAQVQHVLSVLFATSDSDTTSILCCNEPTPLHTNVLMVSCG
jgi:hypothetical protein